MRPQVKRFLMDLNVGLQEKFCDTLVAKAEESRRVNYKRRDTGRGRWGKSETIDAAELQERQGKEE